MTMPKILIAYDGSSYSKAALADLRLAGLPAEAEALVLAVADVWLPPSDATVEDLLPETPPPGVLEARQRAVTALTEAQSNADYAAEHLRSSFPKWQVQAESCTDSPAWAIVKRAEDWGADLVVVGSHGKSRIDRVLIGSVSQMIVSHVNCSVRVGRSAVSAPGEPLNLLIGYDGSTHADKVVEAVTQRHWPAGTQVHLVTAIDPLLATINPWSIPGILTWLKGDPSDVFANVEEWVVKMSNAAASTLRAAGLQAQTHVAHGDPKAILLQTADDYQADTIFIGARGLGRFERLLLGSVSTAVVARASCSVEVVRSR